jgi:hypothetical protein
MGFSDGNPPMGALLAQPTSLLQPPFAVFVHFTNATVPVVSQRQP